VSRGDDASTDRHPPFPPLIVLVGLIHGFGLAYSRVARPEVVLDFLPSDDFGPLPVTGGAAVVSALTFLVAAASVGPASLTGDR
jgi:hypothetical protein